MGYFLSLFALSKSATETALNIAELTIIISGLLLAFGAIGEYVEEHQRLPRWMEWPKIVFIVLVVASLIGEFVGDAGVFLFSEHLQSINDTEENALRTRINDEIGARLVLERELRAQGPRWLLLEEATPNLVRRLAPFKDQRVVSLMCGTLFSLNEEARMTFSVLVGDILFDGAKWKINNHATDPSRENCSMGTTPGIMILISSKAPPRVREAATALTQGLREVIPSSIAKTMPMSAPPWDKAFEPIGKEHPFNLLIENPGWIVVEVGEHPGR